MTTIPIRTASGKTIDLLRPDPFMLDLDDIALHLSRQIRYYGAYNVSTAEHCFAVSIMLRNGSTPTYLERAGLLHDAAEAYMGDVSYALKPMLPEYVKLERRLMGVIYTRFCGRTPTHDEENRIKAADVGVARLEMHTREPFWDSETAYRMFLGRWGEMG